MKRNYLYIAMSFVLAGLMACTDDAPTVGVDDEASRIYLSAGVGEAVSSRMPYHPTGTAPSASNPLNVSVWASTNKGIFKNLEADGRSGNVAIHTQAHFQSGDPQLLGRAIYPKAPQDNDTIALPVYFVGFHPQTDTLAKALWTLQNNNDSALYKFNGKEDVMFAPQIFGKYGTKYELSPKFHFYHLLTLLHVEMVADQSKSDSIRENISAMWGKVRSLTVRSKNQVKVGLAPEASGITKANYDSLVSFPPNSVDDLPFYKGGTNDVFTDYTIPTTDAEGTYAYVMCAPVMAAHKQFDEDQKDDVLVPEYTLHLVTEKRELDIPIDLKLNTDTIASSYVTGNIIGKQFKILLNFKEGNVIRVMTYIQVGGELDWYTHGTGTGNLTEDDLN